MKPLIALILCLSLQGCFFFYIPGSAMSAIGDAFTGEHGTLCVAEFVKVGDPVRQPDGVYVKVAKINGTSSRCTNPAIPIRVEVAPLVGPQSANKL